MIAISTNPQTLLSIHVHGKNHIFKKEQIGFYGQPQEQIGTDEYTYTGSLPSELSALEQV